MSNLSSVLAAPLTPNARATSRLVTRAGGFDAARRGRAGEKGEHLVACGKSVRRDGPGTPALSARGRDADRGLGIFFGKTGSQLES